MKDSQKTLYLGFNNRQCVHDFSITHIYDNTVSAIEVERIDRIKNSPEGIFENQIRNTSKKNLQQYIKVPLQYLIGEKTNIQNIVSVNSPLDEKMQDILFLDHHFSHAASAYYPSTFSDATIITIDGEGMSCQKNQQDTYHSDGSTGYSITHSIWKAEGLHIQQLGVNAYDKEHIGVGMVYSTISKIIGLPVGSVMGLAAYGNAKRFADISLFDYEGIRVFLSSTFLTDILGNDAVSDVCLFHNTELKTRVKENIIQIFGIIPSDYQYDDITQSIFADLAAKLQEEIETALVYIAQKAYELFPSKNICLAGGVALNVLANTKILEKTPFENLFVQPAANDAGLSLGNAYYGYHIIGKNTQRIPLVSPALGRAYTNQEIENILGKYKEKLNYKYHSNIEEISAQYLSENKIIAWFQGGMEFGPRALGFRSLIASAKSPVMKDKVNDIKKREKWRPLAPILLEEDIELYFKTHRPSPYMTLVATFQEGKTPHVPSVVHRDNSARYQTVNKEQNTRMYYLLKALKKLTGESLLINTSLNVKGEPIIESPKQAIDMFLSTDIDILVLENYVVTKSRKYHEYSFSAEKYLQSRIEELPDTNIKVLKTIEKLWEKSGLCVGKIGVRHLHSSDVLELHLHINHEEVLLYIGAEKKLLYKIKKEYSLKDSKTIKNFIATNEKILQKLVSFLR